MIFKGVRDGKPYPEHGLSYKDWSQIPPQQIRLDELVTTTTFSRSIGCYRRTPPSTATSSRMRCGGRASSISKTACTGRCAPRAANRTVFHARVFDMDVPLSEQTQGSGSTFGH